MNLNFLLAHYLLRKKKIIHISFEMPISAKCNYNKIENHSFRAQMKVRLENHHYLWISAGK